MIFISYSSKDIDFVKTDLVPFLEEQGIRTWYSLEDVKTADEWERKVRAALRRCDWFLVVLTPNSIRSDWVRTEVHWAVENRRGRIIPLLLRACSPEELHLKLLLIQYVDFRTDQAAGYKKLLDRLPKKKLSRSIAAKLQRVNLPKQPDAKVLMIQRQATAQGDFRIARNLRPWLSWGKVLALLLIIFLPLVIFVWNKRRSPDQGDNSNQAPIQLTEMPSKPKLIEPIVFEFQTGSLDPEGRLNPLTMQARYFREDLGNQDFLDMVEIPGGDFWMGSKEGRTREKPLHKVSIRTFFIGKYEVTQGQWRAVMGSDPMNFRGDGFPVGQVSWDSAKEFCKLLEKKTGRPYRLPSEAEWEYACRAGTNTSFAFGNIITPEIVNYDPHYPSKSSEEEMAAQVGSLGIANRFGLYDMHGNVWEWCEDVQRQTYFRAPKDGTAWTGDADSNFRVLRGGSWYTDADACRCAYRYNEAVKNQSRDYGFRLALSKPQ